MKPKTLFSAASVLCVCLALALPQTILAQSETGRDPGSSPGSPVPPTGERGPTTDTGSRSDIQDQVILDDLIVDGSICAGQDCVNGESFGFDTIRLKENNLRIRFQDTSNSASFPSRDWQITINDSNNGGANKFSIDDIDGGRTPFTIEAGAPSNSLYVDDGGRLGLGTSIPVVDLHVVSGNTPTLRLEQDGSNGFTPQTWDVAGNEANFFVRDATNGSTLPIQIKPSAGTASLFIDGDSDIGIGTSSPAAKLNVQDNIADNFTPVVLAKNLNASNPAILGVQADASQRANLHLGNSGDPDAGFIRYNNSSNQLSLGANATEEMRIGAAGGVRVLNDLQGI